MLRYPRNRQSVIFLLLALVGCNTKPFSGKEEFVLTGERSKESQYYKMETIITVYAPDGKQAGTDTLTLFLSTISNPNEEQYTCRRLTVQESGKKRVEIPALTEWSYAFRLTGTNRNSKGDVLGIDRSKFESLTGSDGKPLPANLLYAVYNSFIDFHTFCNVFARETQSGMGIQNLHRVGDRVVHQAAFSEPPLDVGRQIKPGSVFKNGEITIEFKGLSSVDDGLCALIGFDSGRSSFRMVIQPTPNIEVTTKGASHYYGDIYVDLSSRWVKKVVMGELVFGETAVPGMTGKISRTVERSVRISSLDKNQFSTESQ